MKALILLLFSLSTVVVFAAKLPKECKGSSQKAYVEQSKCGVGLCTTAHVFGESARSLYEQIEADEVYFNPDSSSRYPYVLKSQGEQVQCIRKTHKTCAVYSCELWLMDEKE